jgi:hypothetical protein
LLRTITTACHVAHLDPVTGEGLLVVPRPEYDIDPSSGTASLHAADEQALLRDLDALGFDLTDDEDGQPWVAIGQTEDGRRAYGLYGRDPIISAPTVEEQGRGPGCAGQAGPADPGAAPRERVTHGHTDDAGEGGVSQDISVRRVRLTDPVGQVCHSHPATRRTAQALDPSPE